MNNFENRLKNHAQNLKDAIKVPENKAFKKENKFLKRTFLSVAGVAAALVICTNCIPAIAYAGMDIPVVKDIVRVITFNRYEVSEKGVEIKVSVPKIEGLLNEELEAKLNNEFKENADIVIASIEQDVKTLQKEYGDDFHLGVDASCVIRTDNRDILAIDTYIVNTVASSSTRHKFYTINKKTKELVTLVSLFDGDYITPISEYIIKEMKNDNGYWIGDNGFTKIKPDQNFFINDKGNIVISFDKYEVAIGAYGCPEFEIPKDVVKDILK